MELYGVRYIALTVIGLNPIFLTENNMYLSIDILLNI